MKRITLSLLLFLTILSPVWSQLKVIPLADAKRSENNSAYIYALPKAVLQFELVFEKQTHIKGPFANLTQEYLGTSDYVKYDHKEFVLQGVKLVRTVEPDVEQAFLIKTDEKGSKSFITEFGFDENNLIRTIGYHTDSSPNGIKSDDDFDLTQLEVSNKLTHSVDSVVRKITLDNEEIEIKRYMNSYKVRAPKETAKEILAKVNVLRQNQMDLISGDFEVPYPEGTLRYMDQRIDETVKKYLGLFRGRIIREQMSYFVTIIPDKKAEYTICKFDVSEGAKPAKSSGGKAVKLSIDLSEVNRMKELIDDAVEEENEQGIYYKVSIPSAITVSFDDKEYFQGSIVLPQFNPTVQGSKATKKIRINPKTGGVESFAY